MMVAKEAKEAIVGLFEEDLILGDSQEEAERSKGGEECGR